MKGKKKLLFDSCLFKRVFNSAEVCRWGVDNFYTSADRRVREFAEDINCDLRRISDTEAGTRSLNSKAKLAWYEFPSTNQLDFIG